MFTCVPHLLFVEDWFVASLSSGGVRFLFTQMGWGLMFLNGTAHHPRRSSFFMKAFRCGNSWLPVKSEWFHELYSFSLRVCTISVGQSPFFVGLPDSLAQSSS
jgi:hypothetical protein